MAENQEHSLTDVIKSHDTAAVNMRVGGRVRCITGQLKGVEGMMVATRTGGRVLVTVASGVYLELPRVCVQQVDILSP